MNTTPIFQAIGIIFVICFGISRCCKSASKVNWGCTHKEERNKNIIYIAKDPDFNQEFYPVDTTKISVEDWLKENRVNSNSNIDTRDWIPVNEKPK